MYVWEGGKCQEEEKYQKLIQVPKKETVPWQTQIFPAEGTLINNLITICL